LDGTVSASGECLGACSVRLHARRCRRGTANVGDGESGHVCEMMFGYPHAHARGSRVPVHVPQLSPITTKLEIHWV